MSLLTTCTDLDSRKGKVMRAFDEWVDQPLKCLIELGIRKIGKDLSHHLLCKFTRI